MKIARMMGLMLCPIIGCGVQSQAKGESNNTSAPADVTQVCQLAQQALGPDHSPTDCKQLYDSPVNPNVLQPING